MKCGGCEECIGETARTLGVRIKEHIDGKHPNSAITEHTLTDVKVLVQEDRDFKRKVKESMSIHRNQPALNRGRGHEIPLTLL